MLQLNGSVLYSIFRLLRQPHRRNGLNGMSLASVRDRVVVVSQTKHEPAWVRHIHAPGPVLDIARVTHRYGVGQYNYHIYFFSD